MSIKTCSSCGCTYRDEDIPANFNRHPQTADGLRPDCKVCESDAKSVYYLNNWQTISDKRFERRTTDPDYAEHEREATRKRVAAHRARQREQLAASA